MIRKLKRQFKNYFFSQAFKFDQKFKREIEINNWNILKKNFKKIGSCMPIPAPYIILNPKYITIGDNFYSGKNLKMEAIDQYRHQRFLPQISIGENVQVHSDCHIGCINQIIIGNNVLMASRVYITDHNHGYIGRTDLNSIPNQRDIVTKGPVIIEDNVWIGEGVCVLQNVRIGENSIIGANSVVTKDVPKNSVFAGAPARLIKMLDSD